MSDISGKQGSFDERQSSSPNFEGLLRSRATPGGLEYIKGCLEDNSLSDAGASILENLLVRGEISLEHIVPDKSIKSLPTRHIQGMSDEDIVSNGKQGELSLFISILQQIESSEQPLSGKALVKSCMWTFQPRVVPGNIDAKEMTLAAIHFLGLNFEEILPLIEAVDSGVGDLEKRQYRKCGDWKLEDIIDQIVELEDIFLHDATSYQFMPRGYFVPKVADSLHSHELLLQKGTAPSSLLRKRKPAPRKSSSKKKTDVAPSAAATPLSASEHTTTNEEDKGSASKDTVAS